MSGWQVTFAEYGGNELESLLTEGWEPFAVTPNPDGTSVVWLRKPVPWPPYEC